MATFQSIVLTTAVVILLIVLIVIGINMSISKNKQTWPPLVGDCPDYWLDLGTGGSNCSVNKHDANKGNSTSPMNFSVAPYNGTNGPCAKYRWANQNNVSWDGITYGVTNPCIVTSS